MMMMMMMMMPFSVFKGFPVKTGGLIETKNTRVHANAEQPQ